MKTNPAVRALLYSGDLLAVDVGSAVVKVLHLKAGERSVTVVGRASQDVSEALAQAKTDADKAEVYSRALRILAASHGFKIRNCAVSLSGNAVVLRFPALPPGFKTDPDTGLPADVLPLIPFDVHDAVISHSMLLGSDKQGRQEMVLAAAPRAAVGNVIDLVRTAGLHPAVIVNDVLALAAAYEFFAADRLSETVVLADIGASSTGIGVMENGVLRMARALNIAGGAFTRVIKREFGVELDEAERLKVANGLDPAKARGPEEAAIARRVAQALQPAVKDLAAEIHRTMDAFLERRAADYPGIHRIVLAGGGAELKGLAEALAAESGMAVEVFQPMVDVIGPGGQPAIEPLPASMAVSCGLALTNTLLQRTHHHRINLAPRSERRAAVMRDISPDFWKRIGLPVAVVAALCVYGVWAVKVARREAAMEQSLAAAEKAKKEAEAKLAKAKPAPAPKAKPAKRVAEPYAFLGRLTASGVIGGDKPMVMLSGEGGGYVFRGGKLYDSDEKEVAGVSGEVRARSLRLFAAGRNYSIELPK